MLWQLVRAYAWSPHATLLAGTTRRLWFVAAMIFVVVTFVLRSLALAVGHTAAHFQDTEARLSVLTSYNATTPDHVLQTRLQSAWILDAQPVAVRAAVQSIQAHQEALTLFARTLREAGRTSEANAVATRVEALSSVGRMVDDLPVLSHTAPAALVVVVGPADIDGPLWHVLHAVVAQGGWHPGQPLHMHIITTKALVRRVQRSFPRRGSTLVHVHGVRYASTGDCSRDHVKLEARVAMQLEQLAVDVQVGSVVVGAPSMLVGAVAVMSTLSGMSLLWVAPTVVGDGVMGTPSLEACAQYQREHLLAIVRAVEHDESHRSMILPVSASSAQALATMDVSISSLVPVSVRNSLHHEQGSTSYFVQRHTTLLSSVVRGATMQKHHSSAPVHARQRSLCGSHQHPLPDACLVPGTVTWVVPVTCPAARADPDSHQKLGDRLRLQLTSIAQQRTSNGSDALASAVECQSVVVWIHGTCYADVAPALTDVRALLHHTCGTHSAETSVPSANVTHTFPPLLVVQEGHVVDGFLQSSPTDGWHGRGRLDETPALAAALMAGSEFVMLLAPGVVPDIAWLAHAAWVAEETGGTVVGAMGSLLEGVSEHGEPLERWIGCAGGCDVARRRVVDTVAEAVFLPTWLVPHVMSEATEVRRRHLDLARQRGVGSHRVTHPGAGVATSAMLSSALRTLGVRMVVPEQRAATHTRGSRLQPHQPPSIAATHALPPMVYSVEAATHHALDPLLAGQTLRSRTQPNAAVPSKRPLCGIPDYLPQVQCPPERGQQPGVSPPPAFSHAWRQVVLCDDMWRTLLHNHAGTPLAGCVSGCHNMTRLSQCLHFGRMALWAFGGALAGTTTRNPMCTGTCGADDSLVPAELPAHTRNSSAVSPSSGHVSSAHPPAGKSGKFTCTPSSQVYAGFPLICSSPNPVCVVRRRNLDRWDSEGGGSGAALALVSPVPAGQSVDAQGLRVERNHALEQVRMVVGYLRAAQARHISNHQHIPTTTSRPRVSGSV